MKKNYHVAARTNNPDPQLISELVEVEAQLAEKRRQLNLKQQEAERLQAEFYDQPVPTRGYPTNKVEQHKPVANDEDFFRKFDRNPNSQLEKKERWKRELDEQAQHNRNLKAVEMEDTKKRQLADDIMNELLAGRDRQVQPKQKVVNSPQKSPQADRRIVADEPAQRERIPEQNNRNRRDSIPPKEQFVNVFVRETDEQHKARIREQKLKEHRQFLEEQIKMEQLRKQEQKNFKKQKVEFSSEQTQPFGGRKVTDPNAPIRKVVDVAPAATLNDVDYEMKEKELKNKYKKGLISLEEYETTLRRLQLIQGKSKPASNNPSQPVIREENQQSVEQKPGRQEAVDTTVLDSNRNIPIGRSEYLPGSQLSAMSQHQPSQYMQPMPAVYMAPHPNQMDMQSNAATIQAFQFEFMKRMFEEMKELMKTNRMLDQQMLQEAVLKNMNLTLTAGTQMPQYQAPTTPQTREQPIQSFPQVPPIGTQQNYSQQNTQQMQSQPQYTNTRPHPSQVSVSRTELFEQSLEADQYQLPYVSSNLKSDINPEQEQFYSKPTKIRGFRSFEYAEAMGASAIEIPGTSVFLTNPNAKQQLKKRYERDLVEYQKLQVKKEVEAAKAKHTKKQVPQPQRQEPVPHPQTKVKTEGPLVITPMDRNAPDLNQFKKPKPEPKSNSKPIPLKEKSEKKNDVERMMNECLQQPMPADDLAEVRRELFKFPNPLALANKHNEILEKYEYSQSSVNDNESLPMPSIVDLPPSRVSQREEARPPAPRVARSNKWDVRQPPRLNPSNVEEQTIQSVEYESIRRPSNSPAKECLQLSRRQLKNMKKRKENVLLDFLVRDDEKPGSLKQDNDQEEEIEEQIETRRDSRQVQQHEESATLVSNYEESVEKPVQKKSSSKHLIAPNPYGTKSPPRYRQERASERTLEDRSVSKESRESNLTSLQEARKRAKQSRPKQKKDGIVSMEVLQQLQNDMRRKDPVSGKDILLSPPPVLEPQLFQVRPSKPKDSKELLSMLDNMVEDDDDHYSQDFESYKSLSRPDSNRYKQRF